MVSILHQKPPNRQYAVRQLSIGFESELLSLVSSITIHILYATVLHPQFTMYQLFCLAHLISLSPLFFLKHTHILTSKHSSPLLLLQHPQHATESKEDFSLALIMRSFSRRLPLPIQFNMETTNILCTTVVTRIWLQCPHCGCQNEAHFTEH